MNAKPTPVKKKDNTKRLMMLAGAVVILLLTASFFMPHKGTERYGLCRVFLELSSPFPLSLRILEVEEVGGRTDIIYSDIDGFGYESVSRLRCIFSSQPDGSIVMKDYQFDDYKRPPEQKKRVISDFNRAIPTLMLNLPSLSIPAPLSDDIADLKISD